MKKTVSILIAAYAGATLVHAADGYYFSRSAEEIRTSLTRAINAIEDTYGDEYPGEQFLDELKALPAEDLAGLKALQRKALLANPTLDFSDVLVVERHLGNTARHANGHNLGLPRGNFNSLAQSKRKGWNTSIVRLKDVFTDQVAKETVCRSEHGGNILYMDLHFDADKMLFSMARPGDFTYRLYEMALDDTEPKLITPDDGSDIDHFDSCYLPDGGIIFASTATYLGMPCINGQPRMASLYRMEPDRKGIRQLGFDQDTSWYPTVLHDGRVIYTRWDYSDMQHSNNRPLMVMNPDGSGQRSLAFSNSIFPASFFYARPVPGHPSQIVGTITGHHGPMRVGRMIVIDPAVGTQNEKAMVRELPGYDKKIERMVKDPLMDKVMPQILQPYPLAQSGTDAGGGEFFLVSMQHDWDELRGIYLVDIYDNAVLLWEMEEYGYLEPLPVKKRPTPPVIPSFLKPESDTATIYIQDIYHGPGLKDVPRGTVKQLRIGSYQFSAHGNGGHPGATGVDSGWDIKTIIGVAPVNEDGSVTAEVPSKTPLFFQPLDEHGQALQGMRSWATAQGGERMSCIGCHESSSQMPRPQPTLASRQNPQPLSEWLGAERPMSFPHEIQPILDAKCVSCHDGESGNGRYQTNRPEYADEIPDLRATPVADYQNRSGGAASPSYGGQFTESYMVLHSLVRHPGIESPMRVPVPGEYGAAVSELTQILQKGHYGVELSQEEWLRLKTWMDYNAPFHGYRRNIVEGKEDGAVSSSKVENAFERGNEMSRKYACKDNFVHLDPPELPVVKKLPIPNQKRLVTQKKKGTRKFAHKVSPAPLNQPLVIELDGGETIDLAPIPAGSFIMGSGQETAAELPMHPVDIEKPFWMATKEITNAQLRQFAKEHDSRMEDRLMLQFGQEGIDANGDELPAVRVSWETAMAFCEWLSKKSGYKVTLPSEAQWEWAARTGHGTPFWFGGLDGDFSAYANLSDKSMERFAENTARPPAEGEPQYTGITPIDNPSRHEIWIPYIREVNDGQQTQCAPGSFKANPWGLYDMHGNVSEWTRSEAKPYPFVDAEASSGDDPQQKRIVRGGSYRDRPYRATSSYRLAYRAWQKVHDVGFRIVIEE
jgi:formylglycine-generating enzyme required for sulfatase activity